MILRVERERERDRDRRPFSVFFFSRDTGSFSIACTVNDHFAPSFRVIQRGVERSSFLPPSSSRVGYLFIATIDSLLPPLPPLVLSRVSQRVLEHYYSSFAILILDLRLSYSFESKNRETFFFFLICLSTRDEIVLFFFLSLSPSIHPGYDQSSGQLLLPSPRFGVGNKFS